MHLPIKKVEYKKENLVKKPDLFLKNINEKEKSTKESKSIKLGFGTLGAIMTLFTWLFSLEFNNLLSAGDIILRELQLPIWSYGEVKRHYSVYISLFFMGLSYILTRIFKDDLGTKLGRRISMYSLVLLFTIIIISEI